MDTATQFRLGLSVRDVQALEQCDHPVAYCQTCLDAVDLQELVERFDQAKVFCPTCESDLSLTIVDHLESCFDIQDMSYIPVTRFYSAPLIDLVILSENRVEVDDGAYAFDRENHKWLVHRRATPQRTGARWFASIRQVQIISKILSGEF
jgi:hypothetical protein